MIFIPYTLGRIRDLPGHELRDSADVPEVLARRRARSRLPRHCSTCTRPATIRTRSWRSSKRSRRTRRKQPGTIPKVFSTHPPTPDRIEAIQKEIATILPARDQYIVTTSEFDTVKHRLQMIESNMKVKNNESEQADAAQAHRRRTRAAPRPRRIRVRTGAARRRPGRIRVRDDSDRPTLKRRPDDQPQTTAESDQLNSNRAV